MLCVKSTRIWKVELFWASVHDREGVCADVKKTLSVWRNWVKCKSQRATSSKNEKAEKEKERDRERGYCYGVGKSYTYIWSATYLTLHILRKYSTHVSRTYTKYTYYIKTHIRISPVHVNTWPWAWALRTARNTRPWFRRLPQDTWLHISPLAHAGRRCLRQVHQNRAHHASSSLPPCPWWKPVHGTVYSHGEKPCSRDANRRCLR